MNESQLPIQIGLWLLALLPFVTLLVLLTVAGWKAAEAGPIGMFVAAAVAWLAFDAPARTLAVAGGKGVWDAIFILYVIWPALLLYLVADRAGAFDALRRGIRRFSHNQLFLVLAFGWVFSSFLQGIAGFGTPIAVVAPLLVAIGVRPVYAVAIPLVGHAWANFFGTLGVSWLATQRVVQLQDEVATAWRAAALLWTVNLLGGIGVAWLFGRWAAIRAGAPMIAVVTLIHGGGQLALAFWNPVLANFIPATAAVAALYPLSRWSRYREAGELAQDAPALADDADARQDEDDESDEDDDEEPVMGLPTALLPYAVLAVVAVAVLVIPPLESFLQRLEIGWGYPAVTTGYEVRTDAETPYSAITPLTHPGAFLLVASLVTWLVYRARGYYTEWAAREGEQGPLLRALVTTALPSSVAVVAFLVTSQIFSHSGQTLELALGISQVAPPTAYAAVANAVGVLGAFMTSSNTASNVLFGPLQATIAEGEQGLSQASVIAAQSAGGAIGNAIAPANVVLGTGPAGIAGEEGTVLRRTLPWALVAIVAAGALTIALPSGEGAGGDGSTDGGAPTAQEGAS